MINTQKLFCCIASFFLYFSLMEAKEARTLVVILAETREGDVTYENFKKNLLDPLKADLAVCIGVKNEQTPKDPLFTHAKYRFCYPEPEDYATAFDEAAKVIALQHPEVQRPFPWRKFLKIRDQILGGVKDNRFEQRGSLGILLFYRWFLLQNILEHKLLDEYEFFVITRSDHFYVLPHPSLNTLTDKKISIPKGEEHDGVTNRHVVLPKKFVVSYLDILNKMVTHVNAQKFAQSGMDLESFYQAHLSPVVK